MDHVSDALASTLYQYRDATNLRGIISALAQQTQSEEDALQDILAREIFEYAVGEQLDAWGNILNVPRGTLNDYDYRTRLRIKIAQMNSEGTIPDLVSIFHQMTNAWLTQLVELFPATIALNAFSAPTLPAALINIFDEPLRSVIVSVANDGGWGMVTAQTIYSNVTLFPKLHVDIVAMEAATVVIGVTDITDPESPTFHRLNPVSISDPGDYEFDIPSLTGMSGNRKYYVNLIVEALEGNAAQFSLVAVSNAAGDEFAFYEDFTTGDVGTRPSGWFDSRGGVGAIYEYESIREAIEVSKCAGVCIDSLTYDVELPAFALDGDVPAGYPVAGLDDGSGTVGGCLAAGF